LPQDAGGRAAWRGRLAALGPLLGLAGFLAVSVPLTAERILHLKHYNGETAWEAFRPSVGLWYTLRSLVDNLTLGVLGISGVALPLGLNLGLLALLVIAGFLWWWAARGTSGQRLQILGLGLIVLAYWLIYSARSGWRYERLVQPTWTRHHLFPHLGLVLFVSGGLPRWQGRWFVPEPSGELSARQIGFFALLIALLFAIQLPRGIPAEKKYDPAVQLAVLRRIEEVDAWCQARHISAKTAREHLGWLTVPHCGNLKNGWDLLRGSSDPRRLRPEDARHLAAWAELRAEPGSDQ
jgi:hypothetical protein